MRRGVGVRLAGKGGEWVGFGIGRWLMLLGGGLFVVGLLIYLLGRLPWPGRLPGDIVIHRENLTIYAPVGIMILLSVALTLILNLIVRLRR
jgi:hypothetical protein